MTNPQGTSFIPQRPTKGKTNTRRVRKIYVLSYISYVLFFGAVFSAAGVFFYNLSLSHQLDKQKEALANERSQFAQGDIESIRDLEKRMKLAEDRLNNHISVFSIFEALEKSAVQSLRYVSFSYKRSNDEFPLVTFTGNADRFDSILFQRESLFSNQILAGSTFKEIELEAVVRENGLAPQKVVTFTLEKEIETDLIGYVPREGIQPIEGEMNMSEENGSSDQSQSDSVDGEAFEADAENEVVEESDDNGNQNQ